MFKIPNWEDDVPQSKVDFGKSNKKKKDKQVNENVVGPSKSQNQLSPNKIKKKKKNHNTVGKNTTTHIKSKANGFSKPHRESGNTNIVKNKNNRQSTHVINQQNQSPKTFNNNKQPQQNGSTSHSRQTEHSSNMSKDKPKKRKSKKLNSQETTSESERQVQENLLEDTVDISVPSKPKKKKLNDLDPSSAPTKKIKKRNLELMPHLSKEEKKKEILRKMLESNRNTINVSGNKLRERMLERLKAAQFRFLNEKLYTTSGSEAQKLFQSDPEAFHTYHQGYQQQLKKWPVNPLDLIVKRISKMPKTHLIADMGCGEAKLSKRIHQKVRSFDLVATAPGVEACDMARTPLLSASVDAAVYCLALMGTDLTQYLLEANRVLKVGGHLLIAEVESRFDKVEAFTESVQKLGFKLKQLDKSYQVFYFMEFTKVRDPPAKKSKLPELTLKPCLYKKR